MEGDLTSDQLDASLLFDFDFDFDNEVDVLDNALSQANPNNQQNSTAGDSSQVQRDANLLDDVETESASENNPAEHLNPTAVNSASNIAPPRSPSINFDSTIGIPQAYNPTTEISREPQPPNTNSSLPESTNQPLINNVSNHFPPPSATSNIPFSGAGQSYLPAAVGADQQYLPIAVDRVQEVDELLLSQLNTRSINGLQNELIYSRVMNTPLDLSNSLLADQQLSQNAGNNYFRYNSNQQALPHPTSYPQINSMGFGITNGGSQINYQQPPASLSNYQNFPYNMPLTQSRPQSNQLLAPNEQCSNFRLPSSSVPLRPQHVANQQNQVNQVQGYVYNPQLQCFTMPENSTFIRSPLYHPGVAPNNPVMPSDDPGLVPWGQELPNHGPVNQGFPMMPNMMMPQTINSLLLDPSMAAGLSVAYSNPGSSQLNSNSNSAAQQLAFAGQQHGFRRSLYEVGESSAPKRARGDSIGLERGPELLVSRSQDNGRDNRSNYSRPVKNALYDPLYEAIGLPSDPHLRCLLAKRN